MALVGGAVLSGSFVGDRCSPLSSTANLVATLTHTHVFDNEAWVPTQGCYRELTSTSNCTTFQARRLQTRYRDENGKTQYAATLNAFFELSV